MCKFQWREAKGHNPIRRLINMDRNNRSSLLLLRRPKLLETKTRKWTASFYALIWLKGLKGYRYESFFMNFLVKKAISPSNFSRPPPTIAPLPAPSTPASRPLYPRFRTLYPRFRTLYPRTPAPPVHPLLLKSASSPVNLHFDLKLIPSEAVLAWTCR